MDPADLLRAVRWARRLSQRELAEVAGLPRSTIDRIEARTVRDPGLGTIERILAGAGYRLAIVNELGRRLDLDGDRFCLYDRGGRHLPAHLPSFEVRTMFDPWWGWRRIAFWDKDPRRIDRTYYLRDKRPDGRWLDAT